ncbi:hypothetical protein Tco_0409848 [Tanacetum coccineum]
MEATMAWRCRASDDLVKGYLCVHFEPESIPGVVLVIPEPVLVNEDEDPEEEEFKEEEEPQEEEDDMEVEDTVEPEDETVPASVYEVGDSSTAHFLREDSDDLLRGLMRRGINSFFGRIASVSR